MEYDETARLKKRYKNEGLLGDAEFSGLKSLLQTKIAPESAGARSLLDVLQSASNMSAENISAPVEGIAWLLEKAGMPIKDPVLGQKWMADRGLTRPVKDGAQKVIGDAAGMLLPFAGTKAGAQAIAKGLLDIGENGLPVGLSIKDVSKAAPQEEALKLAQQRAALPVEKGGLGLPANNTAAQRAEAMGFDRDVLHGTSSDINKVVVLPEGRRYAQPFYTTADNSKDAAEFASQFANTKSEIGAPRVMPLVMRNSVMDTRNNPEALKKLQDIAEQSYTELKIGEKGLPTWGQVNNYATEAKNAGIDSILLDERAHLNSIANLNPDMIRSRFAAFDPFRKTAATAALMGVAAPDLLAQEAPQMSKEEIEYLYGLLGQ